MAHLLSDPTFWVAVSLVLFILLVQKPVGRVLGSGLDARSERIEKELAEATRLREEAQSTLAAYQKKQKEVELEAEEILAATKKDVATMKEEASIALKAATEKKIAQAENRIVKEEARALQEVQQKVVEIAASVAGEVIGSKHKSKADAHLLQDALQNIEKIVH